MRAARDLIERSARLARGAIDALVGRRCAGCGARGASTPCDACRIELDRAPVPVGAAWPDVGVARRLVRSAKFGHWRGGGAVLGGLAFARLPPLEVDVVTSVPAEPRRRAIRGGHLPEQVARTWARRLDVPFEPLLRRRRGPTQQGRSRSDRHANVADAWSLARGSRRSLAGCRVLLVDDLRASGASLDTAGAVLEAGGAVVVRVALVERPRIARAPGARGVEPSAGDVCGKPARCEEFVLTTVGFAADSVLHERRKDAPRVRDPRPP